MIIETTLTAKFRQCLQDTTESEMLQKSMAEKAKRGMINSKNISKEELL